MGCNASVSNDGIERITNEQIEQIKNGTISPLSFQIFLNNFYYVSRYQKFYTELPLEKHLLVLESIGPLEKNECSVFVEQLCQNAETEENLVQSLQQISKKMICQTKVEENDTKAYVPIGLDQKLFKSIMQKKFDTKFGKYKVPKSLLDFNSPDFTKDRSIFLGEMQQQLPNIDHSKNLSLLIQNNTVDNLWKKNVNQEISTSIKKDVSEPFMWVMDIHDAAFKGKKSSVEYSLSLLPQLLNLPDYEDNTPVHYAAKGNQKNMLVYLNELGADFTLPNKEGLLPIHLISNKSVIKSMNSLGFDINQRNVEGESLLDIRTRLFDKSMIKTMLGLGVNVLEPNPNGAFWIQTAMNKKYYGTMKEEKFVGFVRKQLLSNKTADWNNDSIYQEIIARKEKVHAKEDMDDLHESALKQDIPRMKVLLALGTKADEVLPTGETTLYLCAKRGLTESARILAQNYCNTNFTNSQHENTFWVATINEHFDTALVLRDCGADMNIIDANGETIMHNVYRRKIKKIFEFVLEAGASPNVKNNKCQTVTYIAFLTKDDEVAEMLQDRYKGDINAQDHHMHSLVHHAFIDGDMDRIDYLSKRNIDMDLRDNKGHSVLMMAFFQKIDFQTWEFLLQHGSNISTFDYQNSTMLHHLFFLESPREDVFRFLIDKKIDYNIENNHGQFPISIAIEKAHDKFGFELLDLNCKILDQKSIHEPIVEALKRGSEKWFEALIDHGADGMNEKAGVIARYINSGFFKYPVFKKIPKMNIFLEAPIQMAIYKKFDQCAEDLWNIGKTQKVQVKLTKNKDDRGRIPLSAAIIMKNEKFVGIFLNKDYECEMQDNDGRTPFIHACMVDVLSWMKALFKIIPLSNANVKDKGDCSALTYAARNKRKEFCDFLFVSNIDVFGIHEDSNGIIAHYRSILNHYSELKEKASQNCSDAKNALNEVERDLEKAKDKGRECSREIDSLNSEIRSINAKGGATSSELSSINAKKSSVERDLRKYQEYAERIERDYKHAKEVYDYYDRKYDELLSATRNDMLNNMNHLNCLADRDKSIGDREFHIDWGAVGAAVLGAALLIL